MRLQNFIYHVVEKVGRLDYHQLALVVLGIVVFGVICMRGYGSRSNY